jgi:hypothetical protein
VVALSELNEILRAGWLLGLQRSHEDQHGGR